MENQTDMVSCPCQISTYLCRVAGLQSTKPSKFGILPINILPINLLKQAILTLFGMKEQTLRPLLHAKLQRYQLQNVGLRHPRSLKIGIFDTNLSQGASLQRFTRNLAKGSQSQVRCHIPDLSSLVQGPPNRQNWDFVCVNFSIP